LVAGQESLDTVEEKEPPAGTFDGIQNRTSGTIKPGQSSRGSMRKSQQASAEQPVPQGQMVNSNKDIIGSRNSQRSNAQSNSGQPRMKVNINN
tara:strand:+ start:947 stop:1225 length:279 start_codon:yes stop_codon:yes gene_type:complete